MSEGQTAAVQPATQVTPDAIMQLGLAFWGSKTLLSAVEVGVFSELADAGALDGEALRERLGLHPPSASDFFDALVALGMLERDEGRYANTPATELFLDRGRSATRPAFQRRAPQDFLRSMSSLMPLVVPAFLVVETLKALMGRANDPRKIV